MRCLIDSDILSYEIGSCGQYIDEITGELIYRDFDYVAELLDERIKQIEAEVWATEPSVLYLTSDKQLNASINKQKRREGLPEIEFVKNFRFDLAKSKPYKGQRKQDKPFHYHNLRHYMVANYPVVIAEGYEADDLICVDLYQTHLNGRLDAIACSRDKDLRMVPGMHFGWACGRQPQFGPRRVTELGKIELSNNRKKVNGEGLAFFYSQMLTGDAVDNIGGCKGCGPVAAYNILTECEQTVEGFFKAVKQQYQNTYGDDWQEKLMESANLLWIIREFNEDGTPVMFQMPDVGSENIGETERRIN